MISGTKTVPGNYFYLIILQLLLCFSVPNHIVASQWDIEQLMQEMSDKGEEVVKFREEKHLSFLDSTLISSGRLHFLPPDVLVREIIEPEPATYTIRENLLIIETRGNRKTVNIDSNHEAGILINTFRAALTGNLDTLRDYFKVNFYGVESTWSLYLIPLNEKTKEYISSIRLHGESSTIHLVETREPDGDITVMTLDHERR